MWCLTPRIFYDLLGYRMVRNYKQKIEGARRNFSHSQEMVDAYNAVMKKKMSSIYFDLPHSSLSSSLFWSSIKHQYINILVLIKTKSHCYVAQVGESLWMHMWADKQPSLRMTRMCLQSVSSPSASGVGMGLGPEGGITWQQSRSPVTRKDDNEECGRCGQSGVTNWVQSMWHMLHLVPYQMCEYYSQTWGPSRWGVDVWFLYTVL